MTNTQKSIVPSRKKVHTIKFDASPKQIEFNNKMQEKDIGILDNAFTNAGPPLTRLAKKKSSTFSITDIKNTTQRQLENDEIFNKSQPNVQTQFMTQINNMYNLQNNEDPDPTNPYDIQIESLFQNTNQPNMLFRSNSRITKSIPRRPNVAFGKSLSGFSNVSQVEKSQEVQGDALNAYGNLQSSLNGIQGSGFLRINAGDLNSRFELDESQINNLPDLPNISSRNNSFQHLLKNDPTPALFRGSSSIIDPKILKRQ